MADKVRIEAGNQPLCAMTADDIAKATNQPINEVLENFIMSTTASEILWSCGTCGGVSG